MSSLAPGPTSCGPVYAGKYFRAVSQYSLVNWVWNVNFVYKLYTDVVIFYAWIVGIVLLSIAARWHPRLRRWLQCRVTVRLVDSN